MCLGEKCEVDFPTTFAERKFRIVDASGEMLGKFMLNEAFGIAGKSGLVHIDFDHEFVEPRLDPAAGEFRIYHRADRGDLGHLILPFHRLVFLSHELPRRLVGIERGHEAKSLLHLRLQRVM